MKQRCLFNILIHDAPNHAKVDAVPGNIKNVEHEYTLGDLQTPESSLDFSDF